MNHTFPLFVILLVLTAHSLGQTALPLQNSPRQLDGANVAAISLTNSGGVYYSGQVQIGTPPQNFTVVFDTGFPNMVFYSPSCLDCQTEINAYNFSESVTADDQGFQVSFEYYQTNDLFQAGVYEDEITVGGFTVLSEVLVMEEPLGEINQQFDGILGLGFQNANQAALDTLFQLFAIAGTNVGQVFSLYLSSEANQTGSTLTIGGYDAAMAPKGFSNYSVSPTHTWQLDISDFGLNNQSMTNGATGLQVSIASGLPYIVGGSTLFNELLNQRVLPHSYPCDQVGALPSMYITIGGDQYTIPPSSFYANMNEGTKSGNCTLLILNGPNNQYDIPEGQILLGIPFLQNYYTLFDIENQRIGFTVPTLPKNPSIRPAPGSGRLLTFSTLFTVFASIVYLFS